MAWIFLILASFITGVILVGAGLVFISTLFRRREARGFPVEPTGREKT